MMLDEANRHIASLQAVSDTRYRDFMAARDAGLKAMPEAKRRAFLANEADTEINRNWFTDPAVKPAPGGFLWSLEDRLRQISYTDLIHIRLLQKLIEAGSAPVTVVEVPQSVILPCPQVPLDLIVEAAKEAALDFGKKPPSASPYVMGHTAMNSDAGKTLRSYWFGSPRPTADPGPVVLDARLAKIEKRWPGLLDALGGAA